MSEQHHADRHDKRDKRNVVRRRRRKLPWFIVACIAAAAGFGWLATKIAPSGAAGLRHHADAGMIPSGSDW